MPLTSPSKSVPLSPMNLSSPRTWTSRVNMPLKRATPNEATTFAIQYTQSSAVAPCRFAHYSSQSSGQSSPPSSPGLRVSVTRRTREVNADGGVPLLLLMEMHCPMSVLHSSFSLVSESLSKSIAAYHLFVLFDFDRNIHIRIQFNFLLRAFIEPTEGTWKVSVYGL